MVKVISSKGIIRNIEIDGIAEVKRRIESKTNELITGADLGILRVANFMQSEIKESILGNRAEPKSVDSGELAKSISVEKEDKAKYIIFPEKIRYPNSDTTTQETAKFMEYGTSKGIKPRRHFRNSIARNKEKALKEIANVMKQ
jgi:hypothetical protein